MRGKSLPLHEYWADMEREYQREIENKEKEKSLHQRFQAELEALAQRPFTLECTAQEAISLAFYAQLGAGQLKAPAMTLARNAATRIFSTLAPKGSALYDGYRRGLINYPTAQTKRPPERKEK